MRRVTLIVRTCALAGLALGGPIRAEMTPEAVFQTAGEYTVRIKTRIEHALGEDQAQAGAFLGTGFIVDSERGWIVTNGHVVGESPSEVRISRPDAPFQPARKPYVDPFVDVAVLEAEFNRADSAELACKGTAVGTGYPVGACGHPWGLEYTGTQSPRENLGYQRG